MPPRKSSRPRGVASSRADSNSCLPSAKTALLKHAKENFDVFYHTSQDFSAKREKTDQSCFPAPSKRYPHLTMHKLKLGGPKNVIRQKIYREVKTTLIFQ